MSLGSRYRRNVKSLPGSPDFANVRRGWAVFVHGCFWHRHDCKRATNPAHNAGLWRDKFAANVARDQRKAAQLKDGDLRVLTIWECETGDAALLERRLLEFLEA